MSKFKQLYEEIMESNTKWNIDGIAKSVLKELKEDGYTTYEDVEDVIDDYMHQLKLTLRGRATKAESSDIIEKVKNKILDTFE